jgi:multiple sugar transport system ATP-binding protein
VVEAAAILGLGDLLDRKPAALSGGQRQRVALARAIVRRPQVFLMDEPLSNLDAKLRTQTRLELVELWRRLRTTFVYVTHDQAEAMTMATRVVVMAEGRVQQVGSPQEVYDRPANLFVARFVGTPPMNTMPAIVDRSGPQLVASVGELDSGGQGRFPLTAGLFPPLRSGHPVVVGVRPEHLRCSATGTVPAVVRSVERLGHEVLVVCDVAGSVVIVRSPANHPVPDVGAEVQLEADPIDIHLFDRLTQQRLEANPAYEQAEATA